MSSEKVKEYLGMALDMEKNIYIQEKMLSNLEQEIESLGRNRKISSPEKERAEVGFAKYIFATALIMCFIGYMVEMVNGVESSEGIFSGFFAIFEAINLNLLWWTISGAIIGLLLSLFVFAMKQGVYNDEYKAELNEYRKEVEKDDSRVREENIRKKALIKEYDCLYEKYEESYDNLEKFYGYNIINEEYRNLVAIATIYQYFCDKRTYSLGFDPKTGDEGAYNKYNHERRQDIIIDKLDDIAEKLDTIIDNQRIVVNTLRDANNRIERLSSGIKSGMRRIEGAVNNQTAVLSYNDERKIAEQKYLSRIASMAYLDSQMSN
ncbi:MAG: hypothetical protein IJV88_00685 [Ruminococcus sp.]|nr:hypothetical protein [Ruminococcus sp.]